MPELKEFNHLLQYMVVKIAWTVPSKEILRVGINCNGDIHRLLSPFLHERQIPKIWVIQLIPKPPLSEKSIV